jgi:hypothetical protein
MSHKKKPEKKKANGEHSNSPLSTTTATTTITNHRRDGLLRYIINPETTSGVIESSKDWVLITDKFPKVSE